jgi:hypothetical protein
MTTEGRGVHMSQSGVKEEEVLFLLASSTLRGHSWRDATRTGVTKNRTRAGCRERTWHPLPSVHSRQGTDSNPWPLFSITPTLAPGTVGPEDEAITSTTLTNTNITIINNSTANIANIRKEANSTKTVRLYLFKWRETIRPDPRSGRRLQPKQGEIRGKWKEFPKERGVGLAMGHEATPRRGRIPKRNKPREWLSIFKPEELMFVVNIRPYVTLSPSLFSLSFLPYLYSDAVNSECETSEK